MGIPKLLKYLQVSNLELEFDFFITVAEIVTISTTVINYHALYE